MQKVIGYQTSGKKWLLLGIPMVVAICTLFSLARCAVVWDGEVVAVAKDREIAELAVQDYLNQLEKTAGEPVKIKKDAIKYRPIWRMGATEDEKEIKHCLADRLECQYRACGIFINDKKMVVVKDVPTGQEILDRFLNAYSYNGQYEVAFKQKVTVKPLTVDVDEIMVTDQALEYLKSGRVDVMEYHVQEGDTLWDVAEAAKLPVEKLIAANPGLSPDTLQIGERLKITRPAPLVDVLSTYKVTRQEEVVYSVQEKVDQNLYWGEQRLVQKGSSGQREAVYKVTLQNGLEIDRVIVQQKTIKKAMPQIIAKGNKKLLAFRGGNGRLAYPTSGPIVSPFGTRWGRSHEGVDIAANNGSPVVAAEAGMVRRSGYLGGYGLCIDISHGSGVVTRYAHLSSAAVEPGQRVERGQFIGRTGSTGHSTGPHLHFEVMVDGAPKNPTLFI